ncbi:competence protein CoiA family protein [Dactylosporangium sp. CA-233914]|uniref:competence protein CoiA family protein n=1 Tax=Dactylosporangium sp. CA-233914 TaxID=3239934 RepID=UPI003D8F593C
MAFAAIHPEVGRIDATLQDLGCGLSWAAVYKVRPRIPLSCPDCGYGVHTKISTRKLHYFAHDPGRPAGCAWLNESLEHHLLKLELATAVRAADWHAELEVRAPDGTWRADVLASSHDGTRRIAWEAQLSPITNDDIRERTERYQDNGIDVCWVSPADGVPWIGTVPSIRKKQAARVEFDPAGATADYAYGIAVYLRRPLYGILRPSPAFLHRLPPTVPVFVRNAREAQLITAPGKIDPARVVHFDLPDHEQMSLI